MASPPIYSTDLTRLIRAASRPTPALVLVALLIATAVYGSRPVVSYRALDLGAGTFELGLIVAAYASMSMTAAFGIGRAVDRWGERPTVLVGAAGVAVASLAVPLANSLVTLGATQALLGVSQLMVVIGSHTVLANRGDERGRAHRIGLYMATASAGHAVGPAAAGLIMGERMTVAGTTTVFAGAAGCALAALVLAAALQPGRAVSERPPPLRDAIGALRGHGIPQSLVAGVVVLTSVEMLVTYLPAYGSERGISPQSIGLALAVLGTAQTLPRVGFAWLASRVGAFALMVTSLGVAATTLATMSLPLTGPMLIGVMGAAGLALGLGQPISFLWIAQRTAPEVQGSLMSFRMAANRLGELTLPPTVGWLAAPIGSLAIFWCSAAFLLAALVGVVATRSAYRRGAADRDVSVEAAEAT